MSVRLAQSSFKAARSPVFSPLYNALMTTSEAAGGSATTDVMVMLRAAGKKAFFPSTNPATGWWQDSAGTTQAALEQPVGRITDLSGNNYHATQATSLNRPTYTQRVNDWQRTEELSHATWTYVTASSSGTVVTESGSGGLVRHTTAVTSIANAQYTFSADVKRSNCDWMRLMVAAATSLTNRVQVWINVATGAIGTYSASGAGVAFVGVPTIATSAVGDGWYRVTFSCTNTGTAYAVGAVSASADNSVTRADIGAGAGIGSAYNLSRLDFRLSSFSTMNLPAYQRVGNGTAGVADYDTAGFRPMLYFDGTSDALATSAIDLTGTDQIMALCNVLKVSDAATGLVYEISANITTNNGALYIAAPRLGGSANYGAASRGTSAVTVDYTNAAVAAPNLACLRHVSDISSDSLTLYRNGVSIATSASDQGTGNYGNHALYIGSRAGTSLWFKGYMIPGPLLDTTGIPAALLDQMAREQAALWGVAI
jgi:hypothetical protein